MNKYESLKERLRAHNLLHPCPERQIHFEAATAIEELQNALQALIAACDKGHHVERGVGGMTVDAQLKRTVIHGVSAWAVEEARDVLEGVEDNVVTNTKCDCTEFCKRSGEIKNNGAGVGRWFCPYVPKGFEGHGVECKAVADRSIKMAWEKG